MPEKIITCEKCSGAFDVGHIPVGRKVKCPQCGNFLVVPADDAVPRPVARPPTAGRRATPLMRRVMSSRPSGGVPGSRPTRRSDEGDARARPGAQRRKSNTGLYVTLGVVGAAVLVGLVVMLGGKKKPPPKKAPKQVTEEVVAAPTPEPAPPPARKSEEGSAGAPRVRPPALAKFEIGSWDGVVEGWSVKAELVDEVDRELRASFGKGGDPEIRKALVARSEELFPVIADRLRADDEAVSKEAAAVANMMFKKHDIRIGKSGGEFIPDIAYLNDPGIRSVHFKEMRDAWEYVKTAMRGASGGGGATGGGASTAGGGPAGGPAGASFSGMVDMLRHGGDDYDQAIVQMKTNKSYFVRQLIDFLVTDDTLAGRACARALNDITGGGLPVPDVSAYNGAELKKKWDDWLQSNSDKLQ